MRLGRTRLRLARRAFAACAALVFVLGVLHAGGRYAYCAAMGELRATPCCAASSLGRSDAPPSVRATPHVCCRTVTLGALPSATGGLAFEVVPPAPLLAVTATPSSRLLVATAARPTLRRATAPPDILPAARARARLSVFLL